MEDPKRWQRYIRERVQINPETGCWEWQLSRDKAGYGKTPGPYKHGLDCVAHRLAYTAFKGPIPDGLHTRHQCHNRACCNPKHLRVGTAQDNANDGKRDGRPIGPAKLTVQQAAQAKRLLAQGYSQKSIAAQLGVSKMALCRIEHGTTWGHVTPAAVANAEQLARAHRTPAAIVKRVQRLLAGQRFTQRYIGDVCGVSQMTVSRISRAKE